MANHTPGPWAIKYHENTDTRSVYVAGRSWESWTVCEIGHSKEDEQNARLIAAAPELLDALLTLMENAENVDGLGFNMFAVTKARRAISKATGGNNES